MKSNLPVEKVQPRAWAVRGLLVVTIAMLARLHRKVDKMANKIEEFLGRQETHNQKVTTALEEITADVEGLQKEIQELKDAASNGGVTPEIEAQIQKLDEHNDAIAAKVDALNSMTPPKPPVV